MSDHLDALAAGLEREAGDWNSVERLFRDHVRGPFLREFVDRELTAAAGDDGYVVARGAGQGNFTFIDTADFEYSVRVLAPSPGGTHLAKWAGMHQVLAFAGPGTATVRTLAVPPGTDGEDFTPGVSARILAVREVGNGDVVTTGSTGELLDVLHVEAPLVVQVLNRRRGASSVVWTFGPDLTALYGEQSSLTASRFRNVLRVAQAQRHPVPADVHDLAVHHGSPQVRLLAVRSMLASGHPDAFLELQRAVDSDNAGLRRGARDLLDTLFADGRRGG